MDSESMLEFKESLGIKIKDLTISFANKYIPGFTRHQVNLVAKHLVDGYPCLLPNETIYTLLFDGNRLELVEKMRQAKGRRSDQREALAVPPQELVKFVDLPRLKTLNSGIDENTILSLFEAHPRLGIVFPCREDKVPAHLITIRKIKGELIPTALGVWNAKYPILAWLWEVVSCYPGILLVGSSANITDQPPMDFWETRRKFAPYVPYKLAIRDRKIENHPQRGSFPILDLVGIPPAILREGNLPLEEPIVREKLKKILPSLNFS